MIMLQNIGCHWCIIFTNQPCLTNCVVFIKCPKTVGYVPQLKTKTVPKPCKDPCTTIRQLFLAEKRMNLLLLENPVLSIWNTLVQEKRQYIPWYWISISLKQPRRHRLPGKVVAPVFVIGRNFQLQAKTFTGAFVKEEAELSIGLKIAQEHAGILTRQRRSVLESPPRKKGIKFSRHRINSH